MSRIEEDLLVADFHDRDIVVKLIGLKKRGVEDGAIAVDHLHGPGRKTRGARKSDIQQRNVVGRAFLLFPCALGVLDWLDFFLLALGLALLSRKARVVQLHDRVVDLLRLLLIRVAGRHNLRSGFLQRFGGFGKVVTLLRPALAFRLPEVDSARVLRVIELNLPVQAVQRGHPVLGWYCGDIRHIKRVSACRVRNDLVSLARANGVHQPAEVFAAAVYCAAMGRIEEIMSFVHEVLLHDGPVGRRNHVVVIPQLQPVFQDAAHLHAGQREDHSVHLQASRLDLNQVRGLGGQRNHGAISVDRAALDVSHFEVAMLVGNPNSGQFLALFGQHLDPRVIAMKVQRVVHGFFAIEIHRRRPRRLGIGRHREFILGGFLELGADQDRRGKAKRKSCKTNSGRNSHQEFLLFESSANQVSRDSARSQTLEASRK